MFVRIIIFAILCVEVAYLDIYVSKRNGEDDTLCGTYLNPCNTFTFAAKKLRTSATTVRLDGGTDKTYVYYVNQSVILKDDIAMANYKGNKFRPVIQMINQNKKQNYLFYLSKKDTQLKVKKIIFVGTSLLQYSSSFNITITNCSFENATSPIIQANGTVELVVMHVSHSSLKYTRLISTYEVGNLHAVIDSCAFLGNRSEKRAIIEWHATKVARIRVKHSTFKCPVGISMICSIPTLSILEQHQIIRFKTSQNYLFQIYNSSFHSEDDSHKMKKYGIMSYKCPIISLQESKFSRFQSSPVKVYSAILVRINKSSFRNNKAIQGGALYAERCLNIDIDHSLFFNNTADFGGAIYISKGKDESFIKSSLFFNNSATISGGSIYAEIEDILYNLNLHLRSVQFTGTTDNPLANGIIIYTNARVYYTNVSVSITNTSLDVPILDGIRCDNKKVCGMNHLINLSLSCPYNYGVVPLRNYRLFSFQCRTCAKGMYSLTRDQITVPGNGLVYKKSDFKCFQCPPGGKCEHGIVSKGNFWGYVESDNKIVFLSCPTSYCCSQTTTKCFSYNTCNKKRTGILCGTCQRGYRLNYFNNGCVKNEGCNQWLFWILYLAYGILYVVFLMYFKTILKKLCQYLRKLKCKQEQSGVINDLYRYRRFEESIDEDTKKINFYEEKENQSGKNGNTKNDGSKTDVYTSGLKSIIFFFYQIQSLLEIPTPEKNNHGYITVIKKSILNIFNFELVQFNISKLCPTKDLDALSKSLIKLGNIFILFILLLLLAAIIKTFQLFKRKRNPTFLTSGTTSYKIMKNIRTCSIQVTLLGYTAVNTFCFRMLNCVSIRNENYLYIQGDIKCYTWWQYCILIFTALWIIPFTVSVHISVKILRRSQINLRQFYLSFAIPPISFYYYLRSLCTHKTLHVINNKDDIDKIAEIFFGPYKLHEDSELNWEAVLIGRRMVLAGLCAFTVNPISRMIFTLLLLQGCLLHHLYVLPYRTQILNHLETASLCCLIFINIENSFFSFLYMNDQSSVPGINTIAMVFVWADHVILAAPLLIIIAILVFVLCKKLCCMLRNCFVTLHG
ncbi:uncharacterized protein LOC130645462 [Hydractinia symbiolongicarpus]|uniref:uncharacterized protein LOC130645462 n=1 Tax=Hydractinia symbiolongicarpus TaxID=13093 RepID=UPI00254F7168|nr:uncharacterized protein LOC130645462 [Hydractinia symbiolongicarpus]